jgi:hypothetical protein
MQSPYTILPSAAVLAPRSISVSCNSGLLQQGADEPVRLAVGAGCVGPSANGLEIQAPYAFRHAPDRWAEPLPLRIRSR